MALRLTIDEARRILDLVRARGQAPDYLVTAALWVTGDLSWSL